MQIKLILLQMHFYLLPLIQAIYEIMKHFVNQIWNIAYQVELFTFVFLKFLINIWQLITPTT